MIYLIIGEDTALKDEKISQIRKEIFSNAQSDALLFDFESLSAHKLDADTLKKSFITLPVIASKRLVVVRDCQKFSEACKEHVLKFISLKQETVVLVLDFSELDARGTLSSKLRSLSKVVEFPSAKKMNVFDMTRVMANDPAQALKILNEMFEAGVHPLQIMGGLLWFWGKEKMRLKGDRYNKGLLVLQEADMNIKRSRLDPEHAIEVVVVKLCSLLAY